MSARHQPVDCPHCMDLGYFSEADMSRMYACLANTPSTERRPHRPSGVRLYVADAAGHDARLVAWANEISSGTPQGLIKARQLARRAGIISYSETPADTDTQKGFSRSQLGDALERLSI